MEPLWPSIGPSSTNRQILVPFPSQNLTQTDGIESQGKGRCISKLNGNVDIGDGSAKDDGSQDLGESSAQDKTSLFNKELQLLIMEQIPEAIKSQGEFCCDSQE